MNEQETITDIIAVMRKTKYGDEECQVKWCLTPWADRLEAAHKRETDVLKQRCAELNAEIAAKDEVIKRLNDAISEEQRRKMATAENSSAVGDAAKLREALGNLRAELWNNTVIAGKRKFELYEIADAALSASPRNCDAHTTDPDWKDICAKCMDGDIEPRHCEYYGEPNGCNSPIYGEHPSTPNVKQICLPNGKFTNKIEEFPKHLQIRQVPWAKEGGAK